MAVTSRAKHLLIIIKWVLNRVYLEYILRKVMLVNNLRISFALIVKDRLILTVPSFREWISCNNSHIA